MTTPTWSKEWFKPSKRMLFRYLTVNVRILFGMSAILLNFQDQIFSMFGEDNLMDILNNISDQNNGSVIILSLVLLFIILLFGVIIISNIGTVIYASLLYMTMNNRITEDYISIKKGIIFKQNIEIPIRNLTNSQIKISLIDRLLSTADVECNTAGSILAYKIQTIPQTDAYQLQEYLVFQIRQISESLRENEGPTNSIRRIFSDDRVISEIRQINSIVKEIQMKSN